MIEIDNAKGEGAIWRGSLQLANSGLESFFRSYDDYVLSICDLARETGASRFYVGSELTRIVKNAASHAYWSRLIAACRQRLGSASCLLSYAANYTEYDEVPFWGELDEIGIDAYFPLATRQQALGPGRPRKADLEPRLDKVFDRLHALSARHKRPLMLAEWGVVPYDLTTVEPSDDAPSNKRDPAEAVNAYVAFLETFADQGDWLAGVDFWHWRVSPHRDSNYAITPRSPIARLLRQHLSA
jgi:hypothetical protein